MGVGFSDESSWYALFAPKGTPKEIVAKVNADMTRILALPDVKEREATMGYRFIGGSPEQARDVSRERASPSGPRWRKARR